MTANPLSVRLHAETREAHDAAQHSGFLDTLAEGRLPITAYGHLAAQHWFIHEALESAATDPVASAFGLHRVAALEADLTFLRGPTWPQRIEALSATTTYCTRPREMAVAGAPGFIAHHYTRHLGDLSGGQILGRRLTGAGRRFFVFDGSNPASVRAHYRRMLDDLTWSRSPERVFLSEVAEAYRLTIDLLTELKERWT